MSKLIDLVKSGASIEAIKTDLLDNRSVDGYVDLEEKLGNTALIFAITWRNHTDSVQIVEFLLQHGANSNTIVKTRYSALTLAISRNNIEVCKLLLQYGADVELLKPIKHALLLTSYPVEIIKLILDAGANLDDEDLNFIQTHVNEEIRNLVPKKDNNQLLKPKENSALIKLILNNSTIEEIMDNILDNSETGYYLNWVVENIEDECISDCGIYLKNNALGSSALMIAIILERIDIVKLLILCGANIYIKNALGKTAIDIAMEMGLIGLTFLLQINQYGVE